MAVVADRLSDRAVDTFCRSFGFSSAHVQPTQMTCANLMAYNDDDEITGSCRRHAAAVPATCLP